MTKSEERDHVDRFLEENDLPGIDLEVEGIVDRINGLRRRFKPSKLPGEPHARTTDMPIFRCFCRRTISSSTRSI